MSNRFLFAATFLVLACRPDFVNSQPAQQARALPPGVSVERDIEYGRAGDISLKLDLYAPAGAEAPLPVICWVHGGGWAAGSKSDCPAIRQATRGYAVASVEYRLSGKAIFPAQILDCKSAIRFLRANSSRYHLDRDHFAAWGSSAGGHLVALLGTSGGVKEFDRGDNRDFSSAVQAVCDFYGPTDFLQMDAHAMPYARLKHDLAVSPESRLIGGAIQENRDAVSRANPITYVSRDAPPFLIVHGDKDPLVPPHQSQLLVDALSKAGVKVSLKWVNGAGHGGPGFGAPEVSEMVEAFFDENLKPKKQ